jgi:hypothetical protein
VEEGLEAEVNSALTTNTTVIAGLDPAIQLFAQRWMPGTSPRLSGSSFVAKKPLERIG